MRVRNRLLILVLSVLLPALGATSLAVWYVFMEERNAQEKNVVETARAFALLVDKELQARESILHTLASSPYLATDDLPQFYAYAKRIAPNPDSAVILLDRDGRQLVNTRAPLGAALPNKRSSNIAALMEKAGPEATLVSDLFLAPVARRYDFIIQVPVPAGASIPYFLVMGISASALEHVMTEQHFPTDWIATVVDRAGVVVARSREPATWVGKQISEKSRETLRASAEGAYSSVTLDGIPVRAFHALVPKADWKVLISIPTAELRRVPLKVATFLAAVMGFLLVMSLLAARWIAARAIEPIEHLGHVAEALGRGEPAAYVPRGLLEIDRVGQRINEASVKILEVNALMERRVEHAVQTTERAQIALLKSQKLEALGRLTGGIAHEFNNLLQTLATALTLAERTSNQPKVQSLVETCKKTVARATALTGQLGSFGRIQDAKLVTLYLQQQRDSLVQLLSNGVRGEIALLVEFAPDLWPVTIDPLQFELAMLNLTLNACDAMPAGGSIRIDAGNACLGQPLAGLEPGDYVCIRVTDTGAGMSAEVLARALDPFFTTKPVGQGTGLGLPQAYGWAVQSHGTLLLKSTPGSGTTVEFYLPRAQVAPALAPIPAQVTAQVSTAAPASSPAANLQPVPALIAAAGGGRSLLFVEDDALVREAMVPALEAAGFTVLVAQTADEALALLLDGTHVDAVFSDIVMPGNLNGIDLAREVRQRFPALRMVLTTGYTDQRVVIPGVRLLAKPYLVENAVDLLTVAG